MTFLLITIMHHHLLEIIVAVLLQDVIAAHVFDVYLMFVEEWSIGFSF